MELTNLFTVNVGSLAAGSVQPPLQTEKPLWTVNRKDGVYAVYSDGQNGTFEMLLHRHPRLLEISQPN